LFKAYILREAGQWKPLVEFLKSVEDKVMDEITWSEDYALALFNSGRKKDAADTYKELLTLNSENHTYLAKYQEARGFSDSLETPQEGLLALYDELATQFPDSSSIKRIPLNFATGEEFRKRLEVFVKPYIRKTIPSLFSVLKSLYHNQDKVQVIEQVFTSYLTRLESTSKFPGESQEEAPSTLLWVLIYLSYHYDRLGQTKKAIEFIDRAIEHTPTVVELYLCKGRLMKHAGDYQQAAELIDKARRMDLADRYLNTKTTKYMLRAGRFEDAENTIRLFAKTPHPQINALQQKTESIYGVNVV
jgi:peptide alpha-N-acetyltransferase